MQPQKFSYLINSQVSTKELVFEANPKIHGLKYRLAPEIIRIYGTLVVKAWSKDKFGNNYVVEDKVEEPPLVKKEKVKRPRGRPKGSKNKK